LTNQKRLVNKITDLNLLTFKKYNGFFGSFGFGAECNTSRLSGSFSKNVAALLETLPKVRYQFPERCGDHH
jgi:hypothetical protein